MNMFRELRADEIDCRIAQIKRTASGLGLSLLLYKDARCDQNILDETVTPMHWKREHTRDNKNCIVSIWCDELKQWVSKEDTGTESNTEKEKGLASDSFKRACFNWGIGRELYTAPFIWITEKDCSIKEKDGRLACYDRFTVGKIAYANREIVGLEIINQATGKSCFKWGDLKSADKAPKKPEKPDDEPDTDSQQPEMQKQELRKDPPADIQKTNQLPPEAKPQSEPKTPPQTASLSPVQHYLLTAVKGLRELRGMTAQEHNKLFKKQFDALVAAKLAPDKKLEEYTLEEAEALIDAMYKNFSPEGTEVRT